MQSTPFVTVIMPVRNEAEYIRRSLCAVLNQDYPRESLEVIVSDGLSTDGTREIVRLFQATHSNLRLIDNPGKIAPTGLNAALRECNGEIVVRVDGHCEVSPDYVSCCVQLLRTQGVDGVGGPIETIGQTRQARAIALAMSTPFGVGGVAFRTIKDREVDADTVPFPAYSRTAMKKVGLFDEELVRNQDDEYNYRLREMGGRLLLSPAIRSRYFSRTSFRSLWRQYFQYGYWKVRVMQKRPTQMRLRHFVPFIFVLVLLLSTLSLPFSIIGRYAFGLVAGSYALAALTASIAAIRANDWRSLPYLPLTFSILHLAYGSGFLTGLIVFWNGWANRDTKLKYAVGAHWR
jgi:glycosyltransferase involved in cell wall biosynthesis